MEEAINLIQEKGLQFVINLILAIIIYVVGKIVAQALTNMAKKVMDKKDVDKTLQSFLGNLIYTVLIVVVILAAVGRLGVQTTSFVAILGAAGLAIGFALQGSLSNFAAGVMLLIFRPFKVGDFIEAGGAAGVVEEIGIFTTNMRSGDNKAIIIPNSGITGGNIVNVSAKPTRRIDMTFGVGYSDDLKQVRKVIEEVVNADERILKDPAVTIAVAELADSSVNFIVRPWVNSGDYWAVLFDLNENMKIRFDREGISIPFPQQDVHMHQVD